MLMLAVLFALSASAADGPRCSVRTLRHNPDGYFWPLRDVRGFVDSAEIIVRARAVRLIAPRDSARPTYPPTSIEFEIIEVLRGHPAASHVQIPGVFVDTDDFNRLPVPYQMVRSSGQRGDCFATEYRPDAEYLLLLRQERDALRPYWAPLAPLNEQIRGPDDPWVLWVRSELRS
jgi:hypothetical protein